MNNEKIFDFLYKDSYNRMLTYCISRRIKQEDAEEIVDEAFGRLWKKFDQINDQSVDKLEIWLNRAVKKYYL